MPNRCVFFAFKGKINYQCQKMCWSYIDTRVSGSPILQDGKLVGALTHVLVDDSKTGYGIYAENMLETAQSVGDDLRVVPQKQAS